MAGWFTHLLIALRVLDKLPKRKRTLLSEFVHVDDYLFGAVAPDIRYVSPELDRKITHVPKGKESAFDAFNSSSPFVAGYECHLIADEKWKDIVEISQIDTTKNEQKFLLYYIVDRYFQEKSEWILPITFSGNVYRADDTALLKSLGFNQDKISIYKTLLSTYLLKPDIASFVYFLTRLHLPITEKTLVRMVDTFELFPKKELNTYFNNSVSSSAKPIIETL